MGPNEPWLWITRITAGQADLAQDLDLPIDLSGVGRGLPASRSMVSPDVRGLSGVSMNHPDVGGPGPGPCSSCTTHHNLTECRKKTILSGCRNSLPPTSLWAFVLLKLFFFLAGSPDGQRNFQGYLSIKIPRLYWGPGSVHGLGPPQYGPLSSKSPGIENQRAQLSKSSSWPSWPQVCRSDGRAREAMGEGRRLPTGSHERIYDICPDRFCPFSQTGLGRA